MAKNDYVLITSAYNEEEYIGRTIEAVIGQTIKPLKWLIISDGSTDSTDSVVNRYANCYDFIEFIRREKTDNAAIFISKVLAIQAGYTLLKSKLYRFIGILDADITFSPNYYENIISLFYKNPMLGIAGGFIHEIQFGQFRSRQTNSKESVAGAIQLFRRECYESIGGHHPARFGGEDWICEIMARMNGWRVQAFPEIVVYHHKPSSSRRGTLSESLRGGRMDYAVGTHPSFEIVKCLRRISQQPYVIASLLRFIGFIEAYLTGEERIVAKDVIAFLRAEQWHRLKILFGLSR